MSTLIPKLENYLGKDVSYLRKQTALYALQVVTKHFTGNARSKAVSLILNSCKDKVPNVRMVAVRISTHIFPELNSTEQSSIKR